MAGKLGVLQGRRRGNTRTPYPFFPLPFSLVTACRPYGHLRSAIAYKTVWLSGCWLQATETQLELARAKGSCLMIVKATDLAVVLGLSGSRALEGSFRSDLSRFMFWVSWSISGGMGLAQVGQTWVLSVFSLLRD